MTYLTVYDPLVCHVLRVRSFRMTRYRIIRVLHSHQVSVNKWRSRAPASAVTPVAVKPLEPVPVLVARRAVFSGSMAIRACVRVMYMVRRIVVMTHVTHTGKVRWH